jgi:cytochrome c oxidase subunit 1
VQRDDPWGWGRSLEWATASPPPRHNFVEIPRIRSESPAFDLHHPEVAALEAEENEELGEDTKIADTPDVSGRRAHLEEQLGRPVDGPADTDKGDRR